MNFFIKKADSINTYFKAFIIGSNLIKDSIKKEILLIDGINHRSKIQTVDTALYYVKNKIKFDNITHLVKFEDNKDWEGLGLKTQLKNIFEKLDLIDNLGK